MKFQLICGLAEMYLAYSYSGDRVDKRLFVIFILCNYICKDLGIASQTRRAVCTENKGQGHC